MVHKIFNQVSAIQSICATTIIKLTPMGIFKNRSFTNSFSVLGEIIFRELTLSRSITLLKSECLHRYFSKFSTINKEQWSYLKISRIAWEKEGEGDVGWLKFINGGYHRGGITYRKRDDTPLPTIVLSLISLTPGLRNLAFCYNQALME